jgi:hypothetical protein
MLRVPLSMKARNHHYPAFVDQKENPVGEPTNPGPPPVFIDHREPQRPGCDGLDRFFNRLNKSGARVTSPALMQVSPDVLPRNDICRVLSIPRRAVIQLRALLISEGQRFWFQTLPQQIQQLKFLRCGKIAHFLLQVAIRYSLSL